MQPVCHIVAVESNLRSTCGDNNDNDENDNDGRDGNTDVDNKYLSSFYTWSGPKDKHPPAYHCHHHKYHFHPKATSRSATQYKVCRLKQVEVVAHVVHHIPDGGDNDENDDDNDKHDFYFAYLIFVHSVNSSASVKKLTEGIFSLAINAKKNSWQCTFAHSVLFHTQYVILQCLIFLNIV